MTKGKPTQPLSPPSDNGLPEGWAEASVLDLADLIRGVSYSRGEASTEPGPGRVALLRANNIGEDLTFDDLQYVPTGRVSDDQYLRSGDVVLAMSSGSKSVVGKAASLRESWNGTFGAFCGVLRAFSGIEPQYLGLYFQTKDYRFAISDAASGTNINNLKREYFANLFVPVAPLAEQERIVAQVEALLERVNSARTRLNSVPAILKRFRQSVLAAACSGQLTADWREAASSLSTGAELLEQIARERQASESHSRLSRRHDVDDEGSFNVAPVTWEVPETWVWARISDLLHYKRSAAYGVLQPGADLPDGIPFVRVCDLSNGTVDTSQIKRIDPVIDKQYPRTRLQGAEVLVTLVGTIGRIAVAPKELAGANVARAIAMLPLCPHVFPEYLRFALENSPKNTELNDLAREVARKTLNLGLLKEVRVPLAPLEEQREIVRRVETLFSVADRIESHMRAATFRAERLPQAILASAFRGELVPTEAELAADEGRDYEPASALLERIRAARKHDKLGRGGRPRRLT